jgi:hypothetical protein
LIKIYTYDRDSEFPRTKKRRATAKERRKETPLDGKAKP